MNYQHILKSNRRIFDWNKKQNYCILRVDWAVIIAWFYWKRPKYLFLHKNDTYTVDGSCGVCFLFASYVAFVWRLVLSTAKLVFVTLVWLFTIRYIFSSLLVWDLQRINVNITFWIHHFLLYQFHIVRFSIFLYQNYCK